MLYANKWAIFVHKECVFSCSWAIEILWIKKRLVSTTTCLDLFAESIHVQEHPEDEIDANVIMQL